MENNVLVRNHWKSATIVLFILQIIFSYEEVVNSAQEKEVITQESLRQDMDSIAFDATEGRFTASPGYRKAADYAVSIFRKAGLKPGWTDEKGQKSYLQPAPFFRNNYTGTSITIRKDGINKTFD